MLVNYNFQTKEIRWKDVSPDKFGTGDSFFFCFQSGSSMNLDCVQRLLLGAENKPGFS